MRIELSRNACASLAYHVLSHLELGGDAANLYRRRLWSPAWVAPLRAAYLAAGRERIALQFVGLRLESIDLLSAHASEQSGDLWRTFARALEAERSRFEESTTRIPLAASHIIAPLIELRAGLWAPRVPPPLRVFHVPALGRAGRGYAQKDEHRVAVSLDEPWEHVLCQIFHEEVHPLSDRELGPIPDRDTRANDVHLLIEAHAIDRGEEIIRRVLPDVLTAYQRWRAAF